MKLAGIPESPWRFYSRGGLIFILQRGKADCGQILTRIKRIKSRAGGEFMIFKITDFLIAIEGNRTWMKSV